MSLLLALVIVFCMGVLVGFLVGTSLDARAGDHDEAWEGVGPDRPHHHHVYRFRGRGNATRLEETR